VLPEFVDISSSRQATHSSISRSHHPRCWSGLPPQEEVHPHFPLLLLQQCQRCITPDIPSGNRREHRPRELVIAPSPAMTKTKAIRDPLIDFFITARPWASSQAAHSRRSGAPHALIQKPSRRAKSAARGGHYLPLQHAKKTTRSHRPSTTHRTRSDTQANTQIDPLIEVMTAAVAANGRRDINTPRAQGAGGGRICSGRCACSLPLL
jgi:hypothetical protein